MNRRNSYVVVGTLLAVLTLSVYLQAIQFGFTNFDDNVYVTESAHVRAGLTADGVAWAFTTFYGSNWHPVTWLSLMLDTRLGGVSPRIYHATNVMLHLANVLLLFVVLQRMTGAVWRSGVVAALFAVHPLHVESVAWIAERKDVLSTFFLFLTMLAYVRYVERPGRRRYLAVLGLFAVGLMAKSMLVTVPIILLLLDIWPLGRSGIATLLKEKVPLIILSAAACAVTIVAQHAGGALKGLELYPLGLRASNAVMTTLAYLGKAVWPSRLSVFYPYPRQGPHPALILAAAVFLLAATAGAFHAAKRRPWLTVGWLWYLVTLAPVIGIVQVGAQAMADRYTYVPLIGIFLLAVWEGAALANGFERRMVIGSRVVRIARVALPTLIIVTLGMGAARQARHWRSGVELFEHAVAVTPQNALAENNLGDAWFSLGEMGPAAEHFEKALVIDPDFADAAANLAGVLLKRGEIDRAIQLCTNALRGAPEHPRAHTNLGFALLRLRRHGEAAEHFRASLGVRPDHAGTNAGLGVALVLLNQPDQAMPFLNKAARLAPDSFEARFYLGAALLQVGRFEEAAIQLAAAVRIRPSEPLSRKYLDAARGGDPVPSNVPDLP